MSLILGWEPSKQDMEGEQPKFGQIITFPIDLASPASDTTSQEVALQKRRPKKGDPDYVPRPENCFIIFRKKWVRQNARGPNADRSKRKSSTAVEKRLSKLAAEAWKQLSEGERNHFRILADQKKVEHAHAHPDYRYQPDKSSKSTSNRGSTRSSHPDSARKRVSFQTDAGSITGASQVRPSAPLRVPAPVPFLHGEARPPIGNPHRSRSYTVDIEPPHFAPPATAVNDSWGSDNPANSEEHCSLSGHEHGLASDSPTVPSEYPAITIGFSSLAGWNGETMAPPLTRVPSSTLSTPILSSWAASDQDTQRRYLRNHPAYSHVGGEPYAVLSEPGAAHSGMHCPMGPTGNWWSQAGYDTVYETQEEYDPCYASNHMQENALTNFDLGLTNEVSAPGGLMPFNMPYVDEQRVYEEYQKFHF
ncbi:hypothetical protein C8R42DRAFT_722615 [Lentinula raphanica]|nr:hypothetical protein C8R42DRAFT_722615 [Lentinula raphanica]